MAIDRIQYFIRLYTYDVWANRASLASLSSLDNPTSRTISIMAHIIAAGWLWLGRLLDHQYGIPVWPEWTLEECAEQLDDIAPCWEDYIQSLTSESLTQRIDYVNSKGEPWTSTVEDIVMHVIIHAGYHRGQIAAAVRATGGTPANIDFIHATRQGLVERKRGGK